jgi:hypothetical protein
MLPELGMGTEREIYNRYPTQNELTEPQLALCIRPDRLKAVLGTLLFCSNKKE